MQWYVIDDDYMNYLRTVDSYVPYTNYGTGKVKPFFGEILKTEHFSYYAPISSGKPIHKNISQSSTFYKLMSNDGNSVVAVIDLKHCVPVLPQYATMLDYTTMSSQYCITNLNKYIALLNKELQWVKSIHNDLEREFILLRNKIISSPNLVSVKRCLNFQALEVAAMRYTPTTKPPAEGE